MNVKLPLPSWMLLGWALLLIVQGCSRSPARDEGQISITLPSLLTKATNEVAHINLLCARGLPGCEKVDVTNTLAVLDQWVARVKSETERHHYRWERNPAEFEHSKGFFNMMILGVDRLRGFLVAGHSLCLARLSFVTSLRGSERGYEEGIQVIIFRKAELPRRS